MVNRILSCLALSRDRSLNIKFVWVPSHIGLSHSHRVDGLAKEACSLPPPAEVVAPSFTCILSRIHAAAVHSIDHSRHQQRNESVIIRHYDAFRFQRYISIVHVASCSGGTTWGVCQVPYRLQTCVAGCGQVDIPQFSSCHLCGIPDGNSLDHYCRHCPEVDGLLPRGLSLLDVCRPLLTADHLDVVIACCPRFGGY